MRTQRKPGAHGGREHGDDDAARHRVRSLRRRLESQDPELYPRLDAFADDNDPAELATDDMLGRRRGRSLTSGEYARGARRRASMSPPL